MGISKRKVGEALPIQWQAFDGNTSVYPRAFVRNELGALIATVDPSHVDAGLYRFTGVTMTGDAMLSVVYKAYKDIARVVLDENYQEMLDLFLKEDTVINPTILPQWDAEIAVDGEPLAVEICLDEPQICAEALDPEAKCIETSIEDEKALCGALSESDNLNGELKVC